MTRGSAAGLSGGKKAEARTCVFFRRSQLDDDQMHSVNEVKVIEAGD